MKRLMFTGFAIAAIVGSAYAHHSFAQYYFEDRSITIEGELVRFDYQKPHAWVYLDVKDEQGMTRQYSAEWANPNRLSRDNITRDTLKAGDRVVVSGSPGRNPEEYKMHLKRIHRPADGWAWPAGRNRREAGR
jgi:exonuclease VII large subunit